MFRPTPFNAAALAEHLDKTHGAGEILTSENSVSARFGSIKLDCLARRYPVLGETDQHDGIRFASLPRCCGHETKCHFKPRQQKGFLGRPLPARPFLFAEMLDCFVRKYPAASRWNVEKSLLYFDDAEPEPDPVDLMGRTWTEIKGRIRRQLLP